MRVQPHYTFLQQSHEADNETIDHEEATTAAAPLTSATATPSDTVGFGEANQNEKYKTASSSSSSWRRPDLFGRSLVPDTLQDMIMDKSHKTTTPSHANASAAAAAAVSPLARREERARRRRALHDLGVPAFESFLVQQATARSAAVSTATTRDNNVNNSSSNNNNSNTPSFTKSSSSTVLQRKLPTVLQLNIGLYCNQACAHCHVESSPLRTTESMTATTAARCLQLLQQTPSITTLDITGGAPELNPQFRYIVQTARLLRGSSSAALEIIDRCNLTVLQEPGQEDLIDFLKQHEVRIIASLPCYSAENVNQQRGNGVFERSIAALLALNEAGYGVSSQDESVPPLDLVYNPLGAFLPPAQDKLQAQYKQQLYDNFGIAFDNLFTMTNMPIKRFADQLYRQGKLREYMDLLVQNFNWDTTKNLMCLDTVSVDYNGKIYDCDFNQQLGYEIMAPQSSGSNSGGGLSVFDVESFAELRDYNIRTDNHCFGCTAGMGSS